MPEVLRCNICGHSVEDIQAKAHSDSPEHNRGKAELAVELGNVTRRKYDNEKSVISEWREQADTN
ncbi:MAG: hypothetical protein ABI361_01140 [Nitrososphaera sp.]